MKCVPGKEGKKCKGRVQRRVGVRTRALVQLAPAAEALQRVEEAWAHEAHEAEHDDLHGRVVVEASHAPVLFKHLELGGMSRQVGVVAAHGRIRVRHPRDLIEFLVGIA